jgi:hypothetical protein
VSLGQPTLDFTLGSPSPKFKLSQDGTACQPMDPQFFTAMVWLNHTGGPTNAAYQDIFSLRDSNVGATNGFDQIVGMVLHVPGAVCVANVGDVDSDIDGAIEIVDNEWHHFTLVGERVPDIGSTNPQRTRLTLYVDGVVHCASDPSNATQECIPPIFPGASGNTWIQLFNSRSSDTDGSSTFTGNMAGLKIWSQRTLTGSEIRQEMWSYDAVSKRGIYAVCPMRNLATAGYNLYGPDFTVQGANFAEGTNDPPGVMFRNAWASPSALTADFGFWTPIPDFGSFSGAPAQQRY